MLQIISNSNKRYYLKLYINQSILRRKSKFCFNKKYYAAQMFSTLMIIIVNVSWSANQQIIMFSEGNHSSEVASENVALASQE